jgi:hypothetical protein
VVAAAVVKVYLIAVVFTVLADLPECNSSDSVDADIELPCLQL